MEKSCRCRPFFFKKDLIRTVRENRTALLSAGIGIVVGIAFGIYLGLKKEAQESPFGIISLIVQGDFAPFSQVFAQFLRFTLYSAIVYFGGTFLSPILFGGVGTFFFAKYWASVITIVFRVDALLGAVFSFLFVYLPLFVAGAMLLYLLIVFLSKRPSYIGSPCASKTLFSSIRYCIGSLAVYFLFLLLIYLVVCEILFLLIASV